jgi:hypothetical protein
MLSALFLLSNTVPLEASVHKHAASRVGSWRTAVMIPAGRFHLVAQHSLLSHQEMVEQREVWQEGSQQLGALGGNADSRMEVHVPH